MTERMTERPAERKGERTAEPVEPMVLIVSGPSGSGKSTLVEKILELPGMMLSVSCTTRPRRPAESDGKWYNFISEEQFQQMVARGEFLEFAQVFGKNWYGTPRCWLDEARTRGKNLVLEIDVQGATQVKKKIPSALAVFILPPSRQELEKRIRARGQDSEDEIVRRLQRARQELEYYAEYDYAVINDDLERAGEQVQAIARGEGCRMARNQERVKQILKSFGG
jgi:guanylate kinase